MIAYLSVPEGEPMGADPNRVREAIGELLILHAPALEILGSGVLDITPTVWTRNAYRHELTVLDSGEGLYRLFPRHEDSGVIEPARGAEGTFTPGGRTEHINRDNPMAVVGGGHPRKAGLHIFGLIAYLPGTIR